MSSRTRYALVVLSAIGLAASLAALYVHYRLITEPGYTSFCDVNETVSCEQVFESAYGTVAGVPVAAGGAIWSALVLMLSAWGMRTPKSDEAARAAGYVFLLSTVGLAAVFYFAYASFFVLRQACPLCLTMYVSVIGIFLLSSCSSRTAACVAVWSDEGSWWAEGKSDGGIARGDLARRIGGSRARIPARAGSKRAVCVGASRCPGRTGRDAFTRTTR